MKNLFDRLAITFSRLVSSSARKKFSDLVKYSGKTHHGESVLGFSFLIGLVLFLSVLFFIGMYDYQESYLSLEDALKIDPSFDPSFDFQLIDGINYSTIPDGLTTGQFQLLCLAGGIFLFSMPFMCFYIVYFFLAERRTKFVEKVLPDALTLISSNMTSGLTAYHAVKSAVREDFGPLAEAFEIAINKSIGKKSFKESLLEVSDYVQSDSLERSMKLFATAMESGSNVSYLLKNLAQDISERQALKTDLVTSTMTNSMFIMFMVIVGAPMLMAVSIFFVEIVSEIMNNAGSTSGPEAAGLGMGGAIVITSKFLTVYAYIFFFITGFLVASFTGAMIEGDMKSGLKKAPIIIFLSYIVFIIARYIIQNALGGMF